MAQDSTQYPFIASNGSERGGYFVSPAIPSAYYTAPTLSLTNFYTAVSNGFANVKPGGKLVGKANGTAYAIPVFTNA